MKRKKWLLPVETDACVSKLAGELGLSRLSARVLAARGFDSREKAQAFLDRSLDGIHDPYLLKDMDLAVEEIRRALRDRVKIAVYGD